MLSIKAIPRKNPQDGTVASKFYAHAISQGIVDFERLAYLVSNQCTVRVPDCLAVLRALEFNMMDELEQGKVVQFGDLGNFQIGVRSEGQTLEEEVSANTVTSAHVNFRPAKRLRKMLKNLDYKLISTSTL
ncbi:DNA-binding protein, histone-like, putative [Lutibacter oricola]|uniref:DNA-binding protein, histone-like, putative n=1 Tax=Lutibacter oricola TaxID=762486 RepID=A0A1H2WYV7_9FLAO|nr:HU family DNA-binding protein [Lutibacter oricola]SDW85698.1 DNA-binding protein, histone-like, putative [Lutibacter oricola]